MYRPDRIGVSRIAKLFGVVYVFSTAATVSTSPVAAAQCDAFNHLPQALSRTTEVLSTSVLHITSGRESGTAFLIDADFGLFLTAGHVVAPSVNDANVPVVGRFEGESSQPISMEVLAVDPLGATQTVVDEVTQKSNSLDVALLRTSDVGRLVGKEEFELSFEDHGPRDVGFFGASYSAEDSANIHMRGPKRFKIQRDSGRWELQAAIRDGDSGGPMLKTDDGLVVGIVLARMRNEVAIVRPMVDLRSFISDHSARVMPTRFTQLTETAPPVDGDTLFNLLRAKPRSSSNFHLAGFTQSMWHKWIEGPSQLLSADLNGCEIYDAAANRELGIFAGRLLAMSIGQAANLDTRSAGKAVFDLAANIEASGGTASRASSVYDASKEIFFEALRSKLTGEKSNGFWVTLGAEAFPDPNSDPAVAMALSKFSTGESPVFASEPQRADTLATLFHDYQTAAIKAAQLGGRPLSGTDAATLLVASLWGAQVSESGDVAGLNYQSMGHAFFALKQYDAAAAAYAKAWKSGLDDHSVLENYRYSKSRADNRTIIFDERALKKGIKTAGDAPASDIRKYLKAVFPPQL